MKIFGPYLYCGRVNPIQRDLFRVIFQVAFVLSFVLKAMLISKSSYGRVDKLLTHSLIFFKMMVKPMLQVNEFGLAKVIFYKQQLSINVLDVEELIRFLIILKI